MRAVKGRHGFTIIELTIVLFVVVFLAAAGAVKFKNLAENSRCKTCIEQMTTLETAIAVWETSNSPFAENSKCAWGFTPRTGRLTDTSREPVAANILVAGSTGTLPPLADDVLTTGAPRAFVNDTDHGPLNSIVRDELLWVCPSALTRYYEGEVQNVPDDYMDTVGGGLTSAHGGTAVGLGGRYLGVVAGRMTHNGGFPAGWVAGVATSAKASVAIVAPQVPFKAVLCASYGTFGPSSDANNPGTVAVAGGGPVGPDGSSLNRHSSRW